MCFFSKPKMPPIVQQAAPEPPPAPEPPAQQPRQQDPRAQDARRRTRNAARAASGVSSTFATSPAGLLQSASLNAKRLLGG